LRDGQLKDLQGHQNRILLRISIVPRPHPGLSEAGSGIEPQRRRIGRSRLEQDLCNAGTPQFLQQRGVQPKDFNQYGARRGNDLVMARGTFANIRLKNLLVAPKEGNWTKHFPDGAEMPI